MNDSFFASLNFALRRDVAKNILPQYSSTIKSWCKIERTEEINASHIPVIEDKLKININIIGVYTSKKQYLRTVCLCYKDNRYSYKSNPKTAKYLFHYKNHQRELIYYQFVYSGRKVVAINTYNGITLKKHLYFDKTILTTSKEFSFKQVPSNRCIKYAYNTFMLNLMTLKDMTGIDLSKYDYSIKDCALQFFYSYGRVFEFPDISREESKWIQKTKRCGLMYCEPAIGEMNSYDINSQYPSIMISASGLPYGTPKFSVLHEKREFWKFGIYRACITGADKRLLLNNREQYFTHIDLKRAEEIGASVELICDGKPNAMIYERRIPAKMLFEPYVNDLWKWKKNNVLVKRILNMLWGALSEKDEKIYVDDETVETRDDEEVEIFLDYDGEEKIKTINGFKRPHARIAPFLTAYGRSMISKIVEPIKETVYKIHTDGFLTSTDDLPTSTKLGELKLDGEGHYNITSLNNTGYLSYINELQDYK